MNDNIKNNNSGSINNKYDIADIQRIERIYYCMMSRCYNTKFPLYQHYGQQNIKVCKIWKKNIMNFVRWAITHGYHSGLEIDRIDNRKGYMPCNCRWVDHITQLANRQPYRKNKHGKISFERKYPCSHHITYCATGKNKYRVEYTRNKIKYVIGHYASLQDAEIARDAAFAARKVIL